LAGGSGAGQSGEMWNWFASIVFKIVEPLLSLLE
jgi:hypothetical protein